MATKLVYHKPGAVGQTSPFDEAIVRLAQGRSVDLACPYLNADYLRRAVSLAKAWRLVTDLDALIGSQEKGQREGFVRVLEEFPTQVRHLSRLHAKVVVSQEEALVGSANLTFAGVQSNVEVSVTVTDAALVRELQVWFQACWDRAVTIALDNVRAKIAACPVPPPSPNLVPSSGGSSPAIAATLVALESEEESEPSLVSVAPDIQWITAVFGSPEAKGENRTHVGVPEKGRAKLLEMAHELVGTGGQVALYVPRGTEDAYNPGLKRGRVVCVVELLPMPAGKRIEDYFYKDIVDGSLRWPYGWPCRVMYLPPVAECPSLREHVESLFGSGSFQNYTARFQHGPFRLDPKMRERLNSDFAAFSPIG